MSRQRFFALFGLTLLPLFLTACGGGGGGSQPGGSSSSSPGDFALTATAGDTSDSLAWTAPPVPAGTHLTGYDIKRATDPNTPPATVIASVGPDVTSYTDSQTVIGTTYYYRLTARTDAGATTDSRTPPPPPSPGANLPYSDSATPGGPNAVGLGDPAACNGGPCQPPDALFGSSSYSLNASVGNPAGSGFVLTLTLNRPIAPTDLQSVQMEGTAYTRANTPQFDAGITIPSAPGGKAMTLIFDSRAAGIILPARYLPLTPGGFYSLTASVADAGSLKRLEFTGDAPIVTTSQPFGSSARTVGISAPDSRAFSMTVATTP